MCGTFSRLRCLVKKKRKETRSTICIWMSGDGPRKIKSLNNSPCLRLYTSELCNGPLRLYSRG